MILFRLAWRNLWRNRRRTLLTALTISLGLTVLLVTLGLGDGGHLQMIDSAVRSGSGHVVFQAQGFQELGGLERTLTEEQIAKVISWLDRVGPEFEILQVAPRFSASLLGSSADGSSGVQLLAVRPDAEREFSKFSENLVKGEFLSADGRSRVLIGAGVARKLKLDLGDKMVLMGQGGSGELESMVVRVQGIIRTGLDEFDQVLVMTDLETAQEFLRLEHQVHQIAVLLKDVGRSAEMAEQGAAAFPSLEVLDWARALPELADFIKVDDAGAYVFDVFLFLLIAFMVFNTLLMSVLERTREFTLLEALGLGASQRFLMVMLEAASIALLSILVGLSLGLTLHAYLSIRGLPLDLFSMGEANIVGVVLDPVMYSALSPGRILQAVLVVFGMNIVLAMVAARRAALSGDVRLLGSH